MNAGLLIVHADKKMDTRYTAKAGLDFLLSDAHPNDTLEILSNFEQSYLRHFGKKLRSKWGRIVTCVSENISKPCTDFVERYDKIILCGGYFGRCHKYAFLDLTTFKNVKEIILPVEAIYGPVIVYTCREGANTLKMKPHIIDDFYRVYSKSKTEKNGNIFLIDKPELKAYFCSVEDLI